MRARSRWSRAGSVRCAHPLVRQGGHQQTDQQDGESYDQPEHVGRPPYSRHRDQRFDGYLGPGRRRFADFRLHESMAGWIREFFATGQSRALTATD